jgi:hypothetical protein
MSATLPAGNSGRPPAAPARRGPWLLILGFVAMSAGLLFVGAGSVLRLAYPGAAVLVGLLLFFRDGSLYVGYVWWLWFLSPLVRRMVDYQAGWDSTNPVLTAPVLVTSVALISVLRRLPGFRRASLAPFALAAVALMTAYPTGILRAGPTAATYTLLLWLAPIAFGFHLAADPGRYPGHARATRQAFVWGTLVISVYGVWQFVRPPAWDRYWMVNSGLDSIGAPVPLLVRVFSTLNAPSPFALVLLAGLFVLFGAPSAVRWLVGLPGYIAFLLTLVRTAWGGWVVGLSMYALSLSRAARRKAFAAVAMTALLIVVATSGPVGGIVEKRIYTIGSLEYDRSLQERAKFYRTIADYVARNPLGDGLGATGSGSRLSLSRVRTAFDSGVLDVLFSLGWLGAFLYFLGGVLLVIGTVAPAGPRGDPFPVAARAVCLPLFLALLSLNSLVGAMGAVFWGFGGLTVAARQWYRGAGRHIPPRMAAKPVLRVADAVAPFQAPR